MKKCNHCNIEIMEGTRFCHSCGGKVIQSFINCENCKSTNPNNNKICYLCGHSFSDSKRSTQKYQVKYSLDFKETSSLAPKIKSHFFREFKNRISEEHDANSYSKYAERFQESEFKKTFELRVNQLAEEVYSIHAKQNGAIYQKVDFHLDKNFNNLLDHFIIYYCKDLNEVELSEKILSYHTAKQGEFNLQKMILDYLNLEKENETYYTDFIIMPIKKLKNASQAFLFPDKDEKIILIADQTVFGSCKEGFAMTEKGLYWKAHFENAQQVFYADLKDIQKEKDWISINGHFFNISPSINIKMMKLLKKLKAIY